MPSETKGRGTLRRIFIAGLLVLVPIAATAFILVFLFQLFDGWLAPFGNQILKAFGVRLPSGWRHIPGFGILATVLLVFFTGLVASNYIGRQILRIGDRLIRSIPLARSVYNAMRQVVHSLSATGTGAFQTVVMFEYPRKGVWSLGFLTTMAPEPASRAAGRRLVNVFMPTTPNPTSGFFLMLPEEDLHVLPLTAEEGIKIIATAGLIREEEPLARPPATTARSDGARARGRRSPASKK